MFQTGRTIKETLDEIHSHQLVLPAIQREFVWSASQVCRLFDSLMQGYPLGAFLFWQIEPENSGKYQFYDFVREYHQRDRPHCEPLAMMPNQRLTAVLDGQQRLTALNVGLRGTMAWKLPRYRWSTDDAFPVRKLYLDLLWQPDEDDDVKYRFSFLTDRQIEQASDEVCWFPVGEILAMASGPSMVRWLNKSLPQGHVDTAYEALDKLHRVVHTEHMLAYYEEREQDIDKVLQIFIRTNSGGTILSYSDLLLSVAVAQWDDLDARVEIHGLVDNLNRIRDRFSFSKDLVMKAGLVLSDVNNIGFRAANFNQQNMAIFEGNWTAIKRALTLTVQLISDFGFNRHVLRSHNSILPIAYYLYVGKLGGTYLTHSQFEDDRQAIRRWLIRSLLKSGIWSSGLDPLLTALRQIIKDNHHNGFPVAQIHAEMRSRKKELTFEDGEIEGLVDMQYDNRLTFALLSLLFPFVDLRNQFHVDHIFPRARFTRRRLMDACVPDVKIDDFIQRRDGLANLQLLEGPANLEKSTQMPAEWLTETYSCPTSRQDYLDRHLLGEVPHVMVKFDSFYDVRRERLKARIEQLLGRRDSPG